MHTKLQSQHTYSCNTCYGTYVLCIDVLVHLTTLDNHLIALYLIH